MSFTNSQECYMMLPLKRSSIVAPVDFCYRDVNDEEFEAFKPKLMFNPYLQRLYQVTSSH